MRYVCGFVLVFAAGMPLLDAQDAQIGGSPRPPKGAVQQFPQSLRWGPLSPSMPPGTQMAVLEGDPKAHGPFTVRLKVPAGSRIQPHWHPRDERVTVLSGTVEVGFGERIHERDVTRFPEGSFYINPAHSVHFLLFPATAVLQITGEGPWELHLNAERRPPK